MGEVSVPLVVVVVVAAVVAAVVVAVVVVYPLGRSARAPEYAVELHRPVG